MPVFDVFGGFLTGFDVWQSVFNAVTLAFEAADWSHAPA